MNMMLCMEIIKNNKSKLLSSAVRLMVDITRKIIYKSEIYNTFVPFGYLGVLKPNGTDK